MDSLLDPPPVAAPWTLRQVRRRAVLISLATAGTITAIILGGTYAQVGLIGTLRAAAAIATPVSIVWLGLASRTAYAAADGRRKSAVLWYVLTLAWMAVGNGRLTGELMKQIEPPIPAGEAAAIENRDLIELIGGQQFDVVVVLGGAASVKSPDLIEINGDGERIVSAAQAWHAGKTRRIITTGSSDWGGSHPRDTSAELLISLGVPTEAIVRLPGNDTAQEMRSLAAWLTDQNPKPTVGLITSAFHISRAMRLAGLNGLDLVPLPCAYRRQQERPPMVASELIPSAGSLATLDRWLREQLGRLDPR